MTEDRFTRSHGLRGNDTKRGAWERYKGMNEGFYSDLVPQFSNLYLKGNEP